MQPDEELCLCFHVTKRKVVNFLRIEKPRVASQLSECHGAGTGCGWCRPYLLKLFELHQAGNLPRIVEVTNDVTAANVEVTRFPPRPITRNNVRHTLKLGVELRRRVQHRSSNLLNCKRI